MQASPEWGIGRPDCPIYLTCDRGGHRRRSADPAIERAAREAGGRM